MNHPEHVSISQLENHHKAATYLNTDHRTERVDERPLIGRSDSSTSDSNSSSDRSSSSSPHTTGTRTAIAIESCDPNPEGDSDEHSLLRQPDTTEDAPERPPAAQTFATDTTVANTTQSQSPIQYTNPDWDRNPMNREETNRKTGTGGKTAATDRGSGNISGGSNTKEKHLLNRHSCCSRRLCRRVKLRAWTLVSLLVAAGATGALLPTLAYQCMTMAVRRDVERGSAQMLEMRTDLEDIRADMVYWRRRISSRTACVGAAANASIYAPDYEAIDRTIDDPPNDEAIRSLYYELTPFRDEQCCARDPSFWRRLASALFLLAHLKGEFSRDTFVHYLRKANESAYFALQMGASDWETYSWTGIIDGLLGVNEHDRRVQLLSSFRFKRWVDAALELRPDDPRTLSARGRYTYEFARLNSVERAFGSALVGPIPEASVDDAIADLTLAEQGFRDRGRVYRQTWHNLALCFQLKSELGKARAYATEAASQPMRTVLDRIEQRKIEALLGQLG